MARATERGNRKRVLLAVGVAVAVAVGAVLALVALRGYGEEPVGTGEEPGGYGAPAGAGEEPGGYEEPAGANGGATAPPGALDPGAVLYPSPASDRRFTDPEAAAAGFARDIVGMVDPVIGEFRAGDARSGEVDVRPVAQGPVSVVLVRQMPDDYWYVTAALTEEVVVETPSSGDRVSSPMALAGRARAFEGTVQVRAVSDEGEEIGRGFVTGGGDEIRPFEGELDLDPPPGTTHATVVLFTEGGEDFVPWTFTAVRVLL